MKIERFNECGDWSSESVRQATVEKKSEETVKLKRLLMAR